MTLLASFSAYGVHYVIADAAITTRGKFRLRGPKRTSFGEKHRPTRRGLVQERALKLYRLGEGILGAYCGPVQYGMRALHHIKRALLASHGFVDCLVDAQRQLSTAELVLTGPDRNNIWRRWFVSGAQIVEDYDELSVRIAGSAHDQQRAFIDHTFRSIVAVPEISTNPTHMLTAAIVAVQAHGQRVDLIDQGIGGTFWGLGANESGIVAQRDIMYVLYDATDSAETPFRLETLSAVVSGQREHIAYAWRAKLRQRGLRVFAGDVSYVSNDEVRAIAPTMMDVQPHYLAFVERRTGAVLLCARDKLDDTGPFGVSYADNTLTFSFSRLIIRELDQHAKAAATASLPSEVPFGFVS